MAATRNILKMYFFLLCIASVLSIEFTSFSKVNPESTGLNDITFHKITFDFKETLNVPSSGYFLGVLFPDNFTFDDTIEKCQDEFGVTIIGC